VSGVAQRLESERLKYPGVHPDEVLILRSWLATNQKNWTRFDYNVRIGPENDPGPAFSADVRRCSILIHALRLDAVGWRGVQNDLLPPEITRPGEVYKLFPSAVATIVEVKRRATPSVVGQIVTYRDMWAAEYPNAVPPDLVIACATYTDNIAPTLMANRIQLNTLAVDFSQLSSRAR
jgi:hypothetical protein